MKTAISLPDSVFEAAETMVLARGWTRSRLYAEALRQYLRHQDPSDITDRLNAVHPQETSEQTLRKQANCARLKASEW
ncbi:MAG: hypothetical protein IPK50_21430 [Fibrobacterota bacterium]|nr:MAG: hypothetical protein IPK50_21430 [Fibrobacterota bacterium]